MSMATSTSVAFKVGDIGSDVTFNIFSSPISEASGEVDLSIFRTVIVLDPSKINAMLSRVSKLTLSVQSGQGGVAGQIVISDIHKGDAVTNARVNFLNWYCTPVNGIAAPHTVLDAKSILNLPSAASFQEACTRATGDENEYAAGFLLLVTLALIVTQNLTTEAFTKKKAHEAYAALAGARTVTGWSAAGVVANSALQRKFKERAPTADEAGVAAGLFSMVNWLGAALLSNPKAALAIYNKSQEFVFAYLTSSCRHGQTAVSSMFIELREARWMTAEESEEWSMLADPAATLGTFAIEGTPLASFDNNIIRELRSRISAKNAPALFIASNRGALMDRFKATLPAFRTGSRRAGGL